MIFMSTALQRESGLSSMQRYVLMTFIGCVFLLAFLLSVFGTNILSFFPSDMDQPIDPIAGFFVAYAIVLVIATFGEIYVRWQYKDSVMPFKHFMEHQEEICIIGMVKTRKSIVFDSAEADCGISSSKIKAIIDDLLKKKKIAGEYQGDNIFQVFSYEEQLISELDTQFEVWKTNERNKGGKTSDKTFKTHFPKRADI